MTDAKNEAACGASRSDAVLGAGCCKCVVCDFKNARLVSRAKWCCPNCGRDFSLEYLFWAKAVHPEWFDEAPND